MSYTGRVASFMARKWRMDRLRAALIANGFTEEAAGRAISILDGAGLLG